jgi:hypothetical protein
MPIIPATLRLRQKVYEFKASICNTVPCLRKREREKEEKREDERMLK